MPLRGIAKVRGEWDLVCAAFNLRRLCARGLVCGWRAPTSTRGTR